MCIKYYNLSFTEHEFHIISILTYLNKFLGGGRVLFYPLHPHSKKILSQTSNLKLKL